jgi:alpha-tubulin suppressor-like RCC1 family protein
MTASSSSRTRGSSSRSSKPSPGAPPDRLPDIEATGSGLTIGGFGEEEVADRFETDPATGALLFPVVLRDEAPPVGALLLAGEGGGFAGEVVWSETRGAFSLVQLRPTSPGSVFHDLKVAGASRRTQTIDAASLGPMAAEQPGAVQPQSQNGLLDACSVEGSVGSFTLNPTSTLQADVDGVLEIRDGDAVPERFMLLVAVQAELRVEAVLELGGTMQGKIACELGLAKWDLPFPGYLAPFFSARTAMDLVSAITLDVTNGPQLTGTAAATVSGSAVVGFDYLEGQIVDLSDLAAPSITVEDPVFVGDTGIDGGVVDFRLGSYLRLTPGVVMGGVPVKVLEELVEKLPLGSGWLAYLQAKVTDVVDLAFVDMAELELGPELQATWMGNLAVLENRASTSYGGKNFKITSAVKSDTLDAIAGFIGLSTLPRLELPRIDIPGLSLFRPFAPGVVEVTTKTRSGPVGAGEVIPVRAGETIGVFASGEYTFALAPLVDAPLEYGEVWLDHGSYVDELPLGLDNVLAGIVTISEEMCGEGPFQLAILGYNRMFTFATAGYLGAITLECQEAGVALSPKDLWFGAHVNESVEASFSLTNVDEVGGDLVHYEIVTDGDWLSLLGDPQGVIAAGDVVTLGMSGQCPDEPTFLAGGFGFSFVREDSEGDRFPLTDHVPGSLPVFLQCFEEEDEDEEADEEDMGVGTSFGDPWLNTPDGAFYGFQAVGDYVLVASTDPADPFEVQVRFRPFPGNWSANDALAMRVGNSVVNVYSTMDETLEVFVDGALVRDGAFELPGGGSVAFAGTDATVTWPDLTQVSVTLHRQTIGALTVVLPPSRRGQVEGLMGDFDGDPANDLRIRGGAVLVDPTEEELYQDYRQSWRVPLGSAASLFLQGPEYWDPLHPTNVVRLEELDPEAVRWAAGICTELGIVDPNVLRSCIFDVALTGDEGWAAVAAGVDPRKLGVSVTPQLSHVVTGGSRPFGAVVSGTTNREIVWSATGGTITPETPNIMTYTAPSVPGEYTVTAQLAEDGSIQQTVTVIVVESREVVLGVSRVLAAGGTHNLAVTDEGTVLAWGRNAVGQLGDGTNTDRNLPVEVARLQAVRAVAAGPSHSLALLQDGTVWAWGSNMRGQLGNGTTTGTPLPERVPGLDRVVSIAAGGEGSFALKGDGTLWAWGENWTGQLGVGSADEEVLEPTPVLDLTDVVAVAPSYDHTIALTGTGRVWAWGNNRYGQLGDGTTNPSSVPQEIASLEGIVAIAAGYQFSLALDAAGTVWAWGSNTTGQLGTGDTGDLFVPARVLHLSDVAAVAAGFDFRLALRQDGTVWTWGVNGSGQLGDGTRTHRSLPVQVAQIDDARAIVAGSSHALAIREDGVAWAWGDNSWGQLGNGSDGSGNRYPWPGPAYLDRATELDQVVALGAGRALREDGSLWSWGANTAGQLGVGHRVNSSFAVRTLNLRDPIAFAAGSVHALALLADGTVWAWGSESNGRLGNGVSTNTQRLVPLPVHDLSDVVAIAVGSGHNLALERDGTVWAWGFNANGELGVGDTAHRSLPEQVVGPDGEGHLSGVVAIGAGGARSFAITEDGTQWEWGARATETESGIEARSTVPVVASRLPDDVDLLADLIAFAHGDDHSLALLRDGSAWAWGANVRGQLGDGTTTGRRQAVQVRLSDDEFLEDAVATAAGQYHSLAIREDGSVWSWGFNRDGQLGNGTSLNTSATPGPVSDLSGVSEIGVLRYTSFAQLGDGTVWGWGSNDSGAIGDGTLENRSVPVPVLARVPLTVTLPADDGGAAGPTASRLSGDVTVGDAGAVRRAVAPLAGATLRVAAPAGEAVALEAREGDAGVVVLRASLRAPAGSTGALLRAVTLDALVPGGATNPADLVSRVSVYLASDPATAQPLGVAVATGASFDAAGRIVLRLDEHARLREGEAVGLVVTYDIARRTGLRPAASASLLALLLGSPLLLRPRGAGVGRRARTLLAGALLWVALAGCAQTLTEVMPQARQVQAVLTGVEFTASDARAGAVVAGLPVQGAVVTVGPAAPPAPSVSRP